MSRPDVPPPAELFLGFAKASISGFGGVLPSLLILALWGVPSFLIGLRYFRWN